MVTVHLRVQSGGVNDSQPLSLWVSLGSPALVWAAAWARGWGPICPLTSPPFSAVLFLHHQFINVDFAVPGLMSIWSKFLGMCGSPCPTYTHSIPPANPSCQSWSWQRPWFRILHSVSGSEGYHVSQASLMQRSKSAFMLLVDILSEISRK